MDSIEVACRGHREGRAGLSSRNLPLLFTNHSGLLYEFFRHAELSSIWGFRIGNSATGPAHYATNGPDTARSIFSSPNHDDLVLLVCSVDHKVPVRT